MSRFLSILLLLAMVFSPVSPVVPKAKASILTSYQSHTNTYGGTKSYVAFVGDSIVQGYTNYNTANYNAGAPSGLTNGDVANWFLLQTGARATNFGYSGAKMPYLQLLTVNDVIPTKPKKLLMQGGINNMQDGDTWADVLANWNTIQIECVKSNIQLVASEVWPSTLASWAAISNYNLSLRNWCLASNVPCIRAYAWMADPVLQTNIYSSYTWDNIHPTTNGTRRWSEIVVNKFNAIEGVPSTYNTHDASYYAVQAANLSTTNRDTISIPAGAALWTSSLTWSNSGTIQLDSATHITNRVAGNHMILRTLTANETNRITGGNFYAPAPADYDYAMIYVEGSDADNRRFRMDHFTANWMTNGVFKFDSVYGVVDHFTLFGIAPGNKLAHVKGSLLGGQISGNGAWTNATPLFGSDKFIFFETFLAVNTSTVFRASLIDAQAGGRYVVRDFTNLVFYIEGHGSESSYERSTHASEVYNGKFWMSNLSAFVTFQRGGTGLVFSNSVNDVVSSTENLVLENNRMQDPIFAPYGGSDGRNPWDVNTSGIVTGTASSAGTLTVTDSGKSWTVNQWAGYTVRRTSGKAVTSINRSGSTITVVCTGHGFSSGNRVSLFGADQQPYNHIFSITVSDVNTFTASLSGSAPTTPATGTIKACLGNYFSEISANTSTQLTFKDSIQGNPLAFATSDTFEINKVVHGMDQAGRTGGSLVSGTTPSLPGGWNDQTTEPWRAWQNGFGNQATVGFQHVSASIVPGIHTTNVAPVGYAPQQFPHVMISGEAPVVPTPGIVSVEARGPIQARGPVEFR